MQRAGAICSLVLLAIVSCGGRTEPPVSPPAASAAPPAPVEKKAATEAPPAPPAASTPPTAETPKPPALTPVAKWAEVGLAKPESIVFDADQDCYLVSNINGGGLAKDNNGFISVLSPDGQVTALKWIEGGKNKVALDGPKGLVIVKGLLYAADITCVRVFDLKTGAPKATIPVPTSTSLNDIAAAPDGKIQRLGYGQEAGGGRKDDGAQRERQHLRH